MGKPKIDEDIAVGFRDMTDYIIYFHFLPASKGFTSVLSERWSLIAGIENECQPVRVKSSGISQMNDFNVSR